MNALAANTPHPAISNDRLPYFAGHWSLDPALTFLNHGSYGAVPKAVGKALAELRERMELDPVRFYKADLEPLMDGMRAAVGRFVNCPPETIAPMVNATLAIATVFGNIDWKAGDEILVTDHEYMSGVNELERLATRQGVKLVRAHIPFPGTTPGAVLESIRKAITPKTRMVMVSWITSASSLILPVQEVITLCRGRGIEVLVDGTHAPGQIPVDIAAMGPDYFVGSFHKWISAPKGTGFLYVPMEKQEQAARLGGYRPIFLSSRAHKIRQDRPLFLRDFDYIGTDDYTPILSVPAAIEFLGNLLPGGWPALMAHNHDLVLKGREIVCDALGCKPAAPAGMTGCMATIILPEMPQNKKGRPSLYDDPLQDELLNRHGCVVPVWRFTPSEGPHAGVGLRVVRISAQVYNTLDHYHRLAAALREELAREQT